MPARYVKDSKGRMHYIWHQEMAMSCGPASVAMTEEAYKKKCIVNAEARVREISQKYPGKFTAGGGTGIDNLASVLQEEGVPVYKPMLAAKEKMFSYFWAYVRPRTPIIAQVMWLQPASITMQTHFTVLKQIDHDHRMIFLDPLFDVVEVPRAQLSERFTYIASSGQTGQLTGWMVIPRLHG
ncbi:MAG TPA: papain-like cysteine protease family protein [Pyrinomonadaceae bacterium]|nr:papain-like cysteine protease family protein [Pyrinomonadaceae bacterium]